jgi:hypothetical protein
MNGRLSTRSSVFVRLPQQLEQGFERCGRPVVKVSLSLGLPQEVQGVGSVLDSDELAASRRYDHALPKIACRMTTIEARFV